MLVTCGRFLCCHYSSGFFFSCRYRSSGRNNCCGNLLSSCWCQSGWRNCGWCLSGNLSSYFFRCWCSLIWINNNWLTYDNAKTLYPLSIWDKTGIEKLSTNLENHKKVLKWNRHFFFISSKHDAESTSFGMFSKHSVYC